MRGSHFEGASPPTPPPLSKKISAMVKPGNTSCEQQSKPKGKGPATPLSAMKSKGRKLRRGGKHRVRFDLSHARNECNEDFFCGGSVSSALDNQVFGNQCIGAPVWSLMVKSNGNIKQNVPCGGDPSDCRWQPALNLSRAQRKALKDAARDWALIKEIEALRH